MVHDRHQQRLDAAAMGVDLRRAVPDGQEGVLHHILGGGAVAEDAVGEPEGAAAAELVQRLERVGVAALQARAQVVDGRLGRAGVLGRANPPPRG
jgi:hypothetical protein